MIVVYALLLIGVVFQTLGVIALYRFPDVYTRLHGTTKCTTFGSLFIYLAIIIYGITLVLSGEGNYAVLSLHTFVVMLLLLVTNPTGAHAIARAAHRSGIMPAMAVVDRLREAEK